MPKRYPANGQSGGRGADVWVVINDEHVAWLARNHGSLTVMSQADEVVRISCFAKAEQTSLIEDVELPPQEGSH